MDAVAACAGEVLECVPVVLQYIRTQMRRSRRPDLSVPQFRALVFLHRTPEASLSMLADFLGLSLPAASRLVDGLVAKNLVLRRIPEGNRRVVALGLSTEGRNKVRSTRRAAERRLAEMIAPLPASQCKAIQQALRVLRERVQSLPPESDSP
ncbi:MAG: MarR family winged helix-turn-helix transcriptional regulator [Acidobacteriaceae bacterium]